MKTFITAVTLALASGQVLADGFYQQVASQAGAPAQHESTPTPAFTYSPLYLQVVGNGDRAVDRERVDFNSHTMFSYTPLYTKVTGRSG